MNNEITSIIIRITTAAIKDKLKVWHVIKCSMVPTIIIYICMLHFKNEAILFNHQATSISPPPRTATAYIQSISIFSKKKSWQFPAKTPKHVQQIPLLRNSDGKLQSLQFPVTVGTTERTASARDWQCSNGSSLLT